MVKAQFAVKLGLITVINEQYDQFGLDLAIPDHDDFIDYRLLLEFNHDHYCQLLSLVFEVID